MVGGDQPLQRNVISGNAGEGVMIFGGGLLSIVGNYIGTNADGSAAIANGKDGVRAVAPLVQVGGVGKGNLISGNALDGISLEGASFTAPAGQITATVVLAADSSASLSGACAEHVFAALACKLNAASTRLVCK